MIKLLFLLSSFAFCQTYFEVVKDSINTPVEHRQFIYGTLSDSLKAIGANKVLDSISLANFQLEYRTDRLTPDSIKVLLRDSLGLTHQLLFKYNATDYKEGRWIWVPFVGEQKLTTSFDVKIINFKDSTLLSTQYSHTYTIDDWYCGIWECALQPIRATEKRKIIHSSLDILLRAFAQDFRALGLNGVEVKKEDKAIEE